MFDYSTSAEKLEEENLLLRESTAQLRKELERFKRTPLMVCEFKGFFEGQAIIKIPNGNQFYVSVSEDCGPLQSGDTVLVEQKNLTVIKKAYAAKKFNVEKYVIINKPSVSWSDVGGLSEQIEEIKEVIELPLKKPDLFEHMGIQPPRGVLFYGHPGTGKTMLAKAVATATDALFIEVVGSELVQKFIGEGAALVKEIFQYARENAPAIVFIDEIDALAALRMDLGTSGEREVQRTFMQLLAEIDGFKALGNVKIIGCTNRKDILDPALIRPGRLERHIIFDVPNAQARKEIFLIYLEAIKKNPVNIDQLVKKMKGFSGAEIKSVCTEAGYFAIRESKKAVTQEDFVKAIDKVKLKKGVDESGSTMFG